MAQQRAARAAWLSLLFCCFHDVEGLRHQLDAALGLGEAADFAPLKALLAGALAASPQREAALGSTGRPSQASPLLLQSGAARGGDRLLGSIAGLSDPANRMRVSQRAFLKRFGRKPDPMAKARATALVKHIPVRTKDDESVVKRELEITQEFANRPGFVYVFDKTDPEHVIIGKDAFITMRRPVMEMKTLPEMVPLATKLRLFSQASRAVHVLSTAGITHRNLNLNSIVVTGEEGDPESWSAAVSDFHSACTSRGDGWGMHFNESRGLGVFQAPETWGDVGHCDPQQDVFSLGTVFWHLTFGRFPDVWYTAKPIEETGSLMKDNFDITKDCMYKRLKRYDPELATLATRMLDKNPEARASIDEVVERLDAWAAKADGA